MFRVLDGETISVVIEIDPGLMGSAFKNAVSPNTEFFGSVFVLIPLAGAVKPHINLISSLDELIRKKRAAA